MSANIGGSLLAVSANVEMAIRAISIRGDRDEWVLTALHQGEQLCERLIWGLLRQKQGIVTRSSHAILYEALEYVRGMEPEQNRAIETLEGMKAMLSQLRLGQLPGREVLDRERLAKFATFFVGLARHLYRATARSAGCL